MATAKTTVKFVEKEVVKVVKETEEVKTVHLKLTLEEAKTIRALVGNVNGCGVFRDNCSQVFDALTGAGIEYDRTYSNYITSGVIRSDSPAASLNIKESA